MEFSKFVISVGQQCAMTEGKLTVEPSTTQPPKSLKEANMTSQLTCGV